MDNLMIAQSEPPHGDDPTKGPRDTPESISIGENAQSHSQFTTNGPTVLNDQKSFINTLEKLPEKKKVPMKTLQTKSDEQLASKTNDPQKFVNKTATCKSEFIPEINQSKNNNDDDNNDNTNKTMMIDFSRSSDPNSVLAKIELGIALVEIQAQIKTPTSCSEYNTNSTASNYTIY